MGEGRLTKSTKKEKRRGKEFGGPGFIGRRGRTGRRPEPEKLFLRNASRLDALAPYCRVACCHRASQNDLTNNTGIDHHGWPRSTSDPSPSLAPTTRGSCVLFSTLGSGFYLLAYPWRSSQALVYFSPLFLQDLHPQLSIGHPALAG
jgi:hypothetical protein